MAFSVKVIPKYIFSLQIRTPITLHLAVYIQDEDSHGTLDLYLEGKTCPLTVICSLSQEEKNFSFVFPLAGGDLIKLQGIGDGLCFLSGTYNHDPYREAVEDIRTAIISSVRASPGLMMIPCKRTVVTTKSGCRYTEYTKGKGKRAEKNDEIIFHAMGIVPGQLQPFQNSFLSNPYSFILGHGEFNKGLEECIVGMRVGGCRCITVPSHCAYGTCGKPKLGIPPNTDIQYEVKLLQINSTPQRFSKGFLFR